MFCWSSLADEHNTLPKPTRRHIKLDKFIFETPWLPDLLCKHWYASSVCNICRWVADVPPRKTSPAAKSEEKRMFLQAKIWKTTISMRRYFKPSSPLPFLDHGSAAKVLITHRDNTASYAGYRTFRHLICVNHIKITRYTSQPWNFTAYSELSKFIRLKIVLTFFSWMLVVIAHSLSSRGGKGDREGIPHTHPIP